jgi:hypothetical protein
MSEIEILSLIERAKAAAIIPCDECRDGEMLLPLCLALEQTARDAKMVRECNAALGKRIAKLEGERDALMKAAIPFAIWEWCDADLEGNECLLVRREDSGPITVGDWRALRKALTVCGKREETK